MMIYAYVSIYSIITAVVFFNIAIIIISVLRHNAMFWAKYSTSALLILFLMSIIRLFLPLDVTNAYIIRSERVLPSIIRIMEMRIGNSLTVGALLCIIWMMGIVALMIDTAHDVFHDIKKRKLYVNIIQDEQIERIKKLSLNREFDITVTTDVQVPQVTGFSKAHIYMPPLVLTDKELEYILKHELQHFKGKDIFVKIFYVMLRTVFWWNPLVHIFQRELYDLLEFRCDMNVTKNMNDEEKIEYLEAIITVLKQIKLTSERNMMHVAALATPNRENLLKQRFMIIIDGRKSNSVGLKCGVEIIFIIMFILSYLVILQPVYNPSKNPDMFIENEVIGNEPFLIKYKDNHIEYYENNTYIRELTMEEAEKPPFSKYEIYEGEIENEEK